MADRVDHAGFAEGYLQSAQRAAGSNETVALLTELGQVHATLALVEQQRIRNRIALAALVAETERAFCEHGNRSHLVGHEASLYRHPVHPEGRAVLHDDIREGLGL